jgi:hypothetical protein
LRNDVVETRQYNPLNVLQSSNSLSQANNAASNTRRSKQSVLQMENANSLYPQNNIINQVAAKANAPDASFNVPSVLMSNTNLQMLNIENAVQSGYSLDGINILDIKPIKGLSSDIVQISKVTNKIPIIEIPVSYNYYETTTTPVVHRSTNLHTASSLASQGRGSQTTFTKAPEMFTMTTKGCK